MAVAVHDLSSAIAEARWTQSQRLKELEEFYSKEFGTKPQFYVRVPGRVNIIGEHVDYCGYPVLPMAIDQCILLAVGANENSELIQLVNIESEKFAKYKCNLKDISIDLPTASGPEWYKYYLCGVKGIYETMQSDESLLGMTVAVSGNIPPSSGLSSSSAMVSAAALATAHVQRLLLERKRLASISASCERYIGTQGGGMDQAIAYLAKPGCAQFIEFHPELNATPVELPTGVCFVVANSLAEKNKAASSDFNERVVECRISARIIAKSMALSDWRQITHFAQLQEALHCNLITLEHLANKFLPKDLYTRQDICELLNISEEEFEQFLTPNTRHMDKFKLRQRALHVIQESLRVVKFRLICERAATKSCTNGSNGNNSHATDSADDRRLLDDNLSTLSQLMQQSHESLRDLYQCSHPDLDRMIAISSGIDVGARLTGAGWGGCIVALCSSLDVSQKYIAEMKEKYYAQLPSHIIERYQHNDFADVIFATAPGGGAEIFKC